MKKLLITESIKPAVDTGESLLTRKDIKIFTALSGEELIEIHKSENVDLILADLAPGKNGDDEIFRALRTIKEDNLLRNVLVITVCNSDKLSIAKSHASGANAFITKPVDAIELINKIVKFFNVLNRGSRRVILNVSVKGETSEKFFFANSEDISDTGILFEVDEILQKGERMTCSFFLAKDLIISDVKVVRVLEKAPGQYLYGVQFINLNQISKARLERFIETNIDN